jgi:hypothetical protein
LSTTGFILQNDVRKQEYLRLRDRYYRLQSYILDNLTHDSERIKLVSLAYADDIAVAVSSDPRIEKGTSVMRKYVELLDRWLEENGFQMSTRKTKILHFAAENTAVRTQISVCVVSHFKWSTTQGTFTFDFKLRWGVQETKMSCSRFTAVT